MADDTPARIDRAALDRIIQRAAELQTADRDLGDGLTPEELLTLGREVGIPGQFLQQALAEERMRISVLAPSGVVERLAGPAAVAAHRVVQGTPESVQRALVSWMEDQELLCIQREQPGRVTWEPVRGFQAAVRRSSAAFGGGRKPFMLARADTVSAVLTSLESGRTHVALSADLRRARGQAFGGSAGVVGAGVVATGLMLTLGAITAVALLPLPGAIAIGYAVLRQNRPRSERVVLGLERALDHLEQGGPHLPPARGSGAPGLLALLANDVRRVLKP